MFFVTTGCLVASWWFFAVTIGRDFSTGLRVSLDALLKCAGPNSLPVTASYFLPFKIIVVSDICCNSLFAYDDYIIKLLLKACNLIQLFDFTRRLNDCVF